MFETIILLTSSPEEAVLAGLLTSHNPTLSIRYGKSHADLDTLSPAVLERARLIGFATSVIVPGSVLERLGFGAYNFHPGSPYYPGWAPAYFACYQRAPIFGATMHMMVERVDAGPIVAVDLFNVPPGSTPPQLELLAYKRLASLYWTWAKTLATQPEPLPTLPISWHGRKSSRRIYETLCEIPPDIAKDDLDRRVEAFGGGELGVRPSLTVHGRRFQYVGDAPEAAVVVAEPAKHVA
ncbi:MAG TPA: formyltransferase family protein [Pseudolabrys sp.]|nr:formyltransferase family protein [Pseudolabrys sp.]